MRFDNIPLSPYLNIILDIIRSGIKECSSKLIISQNEGLKNQEITNTLNTISTINEKVWIGVNNENINKGRKAREDIYFYLNDDNHTRIFYIEGKRLPKYNTKSKEEYIFGVNSHGNPSGGIERFKKGIHGNPHRIFNNGLIAYIENESFEFWFQKINNTIQEKYSYEERIIREKDFSNECTSSHPYECEANADSFILHHFWIDLTEKADK